MSESLLSGRLSVTATRPPPRRSGARRPQSDRGGTTGLAVGDLVLLGGRRFARFGDALWAVAEHRGGVLLVRPAKIRRDEKLSDDGSRIVTKGPEDKPRFYRSPEERARDWNSQPD